MNSFKPIVIICIWVAGLTLPLFGQIVIDWNEIPHIVNTRWTKNIATNQTVSLGSAGGPQNWYFTSQPMGSDSCTDVVVLVAQTPFHDSFPNANLCYMSIDGPDSAFLYIRLVSSFISTLGIAGEDTSGNMFIKYNPVDTNNLPEHYGDNRYYRAGWRYDIDASTYMTYVKKGYETINAYGNVTIPYGTFPCLRYILFDTLIQTMYYNNVPIYCDTSTRISHQFVAENRSGVVCVFSNSGETNPYFTNAATLERLTYFYTAIEETGPGSSEKTVQVHPNPFDNGVTFAYTPEIYEDMSLKIYDVQGQIVKTLNLPRAHSVLPACVAWDGTKDNGTRLPAGVYFYRFQAGERMAIGKVVKVK